MKTQILTCGVIAMGASVAAADINYGPYTFADNAFADRAVDNSGLNQYFFNDAATVQEALTGFTPDSGLYNIGLAGNSNDFTLFFDDLQASDIPGADIVLFDLRYSADPYEIAVITGGNESAYLLYDAASQVDTGEVQDVNARAWAIEIDLADYGVATAEAIRFRALENDTNLTEGDPTMAGVLVPAPGAVALFGLGGLAALRRRR